MGLRYNIEMKKEGPELGRYPITSEMSMIANFINRLSGIALEVRAQGKKVGVDMSPNWEDMTKGKYRDIWTIGAVVARLPDDVRKYLGGRKFTSMRMSNLVVVDMNEIDLRWYPDLHTKKEVVARAYGNVMFEGTRDFSKDPIKGVFRLSGIGLSDGSIRVGWRKEISPESEVGLEAEMLRRRGGLDDDANVIRRITGRR